MINISENDWKLFRARIPEWQERYMEQLEKEYIELLSSQQPASSRFRELEKRIGEDKKHPGVVVELRRSVAVQNIISLVESGVVTLEDFEGFSEELIDVVKALCWDRFMSSEIVDIEKEK